MFVCTYIAFHKFSCCLKNAVNAKLTLNKEKKNVMVSSALLWRSLNLTSVVVVSYTKIFQNSVNFKMCLNAKLLKYFAGFLGENGFND